MRLVLKQILSPTGDYICVLLGSKTPMVLRPLHDGSGFRVIGECYVHGLDDCVTLLGTLPSNVRVQLDKMQSGYSAVPTYLNLDSGVVSSEDPRLQSSNETDEWERIPHQWDADDPALFEYWRNKRTGVVLNSDPRLSPAALRQRGVTLQTFKLR
jgi:hypothetical protein